MSLADYLLQQCQRRGVAIKVVGDELEVEFDRANPQHDLINDLRAVQSRCHSSVARRAVGRAALSGFATAAAGGKLVRRWRQQRD